MLLHLTDDQQSLRDTTDRYLSKTVPVGTLRALRDDPMGFEAEWWRDGAGLGWTSVLVPEEAGGGTVSGRPLADATLLAFEFGRHAAPGPFLPGNLAAAALGGDAVRHRELLEQVLAGTGVVAWCLTELHADGHHPDGLRCTISADGDTVVVDGVKRPVESGVAASHLLVTGRSADGLTQVLVPVDAAGVSVEPMDTVDLTRRFSVVRFDRVRVPSSAVVGEMGGAGEQVEHQWRMGLVLLAAESLGAMERAFDMTLQWAFDRYSFGRPLASYQELKHRFADMKTWLEAGHAIADTAAAAMDDGGADVAELVSAAAAFTGQYGAELLHDCVQMHGGIGLTYEHDLHLYLRRMVLNRTLLGTPAQHRRRIATLLADGARS